ncbi:MAG: hypothetical protein AAFY28_19985, partial [Actinomycetota bacterium]
MTSGPMRRSVGASLGCAFVLLAGVISPFVGSHSASSIESAVTQVDASTDAPSCTSETVDGSPYVRCVLSDTTNVVDLAELPGVESASSETPIWIQMWGGKGGDASPTPTLDFIQGPGGPAGFVQLVTSVEAYTGAFGTSSLYYALGKAGGHANTESNLPSGGTGGAATIVTSVDPTTIALDESNVVGIAGGGGGGALTIYEPPARGGEGGLRMSNRSKTNGAGMSGGDLYGGGPGSLREPGEGGSASFVPSGGIEGVDGFSGFGGTGGARKNLTGGATNPTGWVNAADLAAALGTDGSGGEARCAPNLCSSGAGGGGFGGGASGSYAEVTDDGTTTQYPSGGGGGGSYLTEMPVAVSDPNAPTKWVDSPTDGVGAVHVVVKLDVDFQSTFCAEAVLAGIDGFRCVVPFNWAFEIPTEFTGDEWLVTLQAQGGFGASGGPGGRAQTTLTTTGLEDETLYAWVGAGGVSSNTHGGGGGGASVLSLAPDPFTAVTSSGVTSDMLLVAGGGGGAVRLLGLCASQGGAGGVAVAGSSGEQVVGAGSSGDGASTGGGGSTAGAGGAYTNGAWAGGAGGAAVQSPDGDDLSDPGTAGSSGLTLVGG